MSKLRPQGMPEGRAETPTGVPLPASAIEVALRLELAEAVRLLGRYLSDAEEAGRPSEVGSDWFADGVAFLRRHQ